MTAQPGRGQPGSRRDRITPNKRRLLEGLCVQHPHDGARWAPGDLISFAVQDGRFRDASVQGLHQTAASLVRKGLATRHKYGSRGRVRYQITDAGRAALRGSTSG